MPRRLVLVPILVAAALPGSAAAYTNPQIPGLQIALRAHGYDVGPIDGIVGRRTAGAVRAFQRRAGIHADGLAGPRTRTRLGRLGRPLFGARTMARGRIGWDVSVLQFLLARRGFAPPHLNGNFGRGTERAVRSPLSHSSRTRSPATAGTVERTRPRARAPRYAPISSAPATR